MSFYGLIGEKLGHSFSTFLHWEFNNSEYELMEIPRSSIKEYLAKADFKGINVTIPYKETAMEYCIPDQVATQIGCVNTLVRIDAVNTKAGESDEELLEPVVYGFNTDCLGFKYMLEREGISLSNKKILILGTGGTSKTARYVCSKMGAYSVTVASRKRMKPDNNQEGDGAQYITYDEIESVLNEVQVLINTTPVGMYPNNYESPVDISIFPSLEAVVDVIYNPLVTKLVSEAQKRGIKATCGLPMLVAQAYFAEILFFSNDIPYDRDIFEDEGLLSKEGIRSIEKVLGNIISLKQNLVLVGMPGCGKSTIGRILAQELGRELVDTDAVFKEKMNIAPGDYITTYGEDAFRDEESQVVKDISKNSGIIISTGGGSILRPENVDALKANGKLIYLSRPIEDLAVKNRPLSQKVGLEELFKKRKPIYENIADITQEVMATPEMTTKEILKRL